MVWWSYSSNFRYVAVITRAPRHNTDFKLNVSKQPEPIVFKAQESVWLASLQGCHLI